MSRRLLEVLLAIVVGASIVAVAFTVMARGDADPANDAGDEANATTTVLASSARSADVEAFLETWQASQALDVVVIGEEQVIEVSPDEGVEPLTVQGVVSGAISVRRARLGDRRIEQIGTGALVIDSTGQRSCDLIDGQFLCTDPTATPTDDEAIAEFTDRLVGPDAPYELFDDGNGCWRAVAVEPSPLLRWGQISAWCFDTDTGALARSAIWRGDTSVVRFEAHEIRLEVSPRDLDPQ